ncbi:hypothetical protein PCE1_004588 [Barthelona sp. PCE]
MSFDKQFIADRLAIYEELKEKYTVSDHVVEDVDINVTMPDGTVIVGKAGISTPNSIAAGIAKSLAKRSCVAKVNNQLWGMQEPLMEDCSLFLLDFDSEEGKEVFWHSSAHVLGMVLEDLFGAELGTGPCDERGFFYDAQLQDGSTIDASRVSEIEKAYKAAVRNPNKFEKLIVSKDDAKHLFAYSKFKTEILNEVIPAEEETVSIFRVGDFVDLCRGPHLFSSKSIGAYMVVSASNAWWRGVSDGEQLQRVRMITFPDKKALQAHKKFLKEAEARNHIKIGAKQKLWFFDPDMSAGSPFFLPHGQRIYQKLMDLVRSFYHKFDYMEVQTPNMADKRLWETSGHWEHYQEDMFTFEVGQKQSVIEEKRARGEEVKENSIFGLAAMNCPFHCVCFKNVVNSYRDLPVRYAEFGVLHRNEDSGALAGLSRVRRFIQDDGHIYIEPHMIEEEIMSVLSMVREIYDLIGLEFELTLSTRPEKAMGNDEFWERAEAALSSVLQKLGLPYRINEGDGAFYGPKIDIKVRDALRRSHQCATIQLDFQMPRAFNLVYKNRDGEDEYPVMIHRAILGSLERFLAMITEHYAGKWPLWLSPRQVQIIPVTGVFHEYAVSVKDILKSKKIYVDVDLSTNTLPKKIRNAQTAQYNYMVVVGEQEANSNSVMVRKRDEKEQTLMTIEDFVALLEKEGNVF